MPHHNRMGNIFRLRSNDRDTIRKSYLSILSIVKIYSTSRALFCMLPRQKEIFNPNQNVFLILLRLPCLCFIYIYGNYHKDILGLYIRIPSKDAFLLFHHKYLDSAHHTYTVSHVTPLLQIKFYSWCYSGRHVYVSIYKYGVYHTDIPRLYRWTPWKEWLLLFHYRHLDGLHHTYTGSHGSQLLSSFLEKQWLRQSS